jgi:RNA polymerase sigma-70 factor (ECF subfamily)
MNETSLSLLERACGPTSHEAFRRLAEMYSPLLRKWTERLDISAVDADDLVQEVLISVARELPKFNHSGQTGAFRAWLRRMLLNRVRDFWRSRNYRPAALGGSTWSQQIEQLEDDTSRASREWNLEHDRHVLARLMDEIRPRFEPKTWEAFYRQVFGEERADTVAAELEMPLNSVYVARSRVLSALRREAAGLIDHF